MDRGKATCVSSSAATRRETVYVADLPIHCKEGLKLLKGTIGLGIILQASAGFLFVFYFASVILSRPLRSILIQENMWSDYIDLAWM